MAVRFDAPIYTTQQVLNEAGILLEIDDNSKEEDDVFSETESGSENLHHVSTEELQKFLENAVKEEDFDTALEIQEELKKRKKNID
jgi:bifunctional DNase/RNase